VNRLWFRGTVSRITIGVVTVVLLGLADQVVQNLSMNRILTASDDIQDVLLTYRDHLISLDEYVRANRSNLEDPATYFETRVALLAGDALPPLGYNYAALQRVVVLPWHTRIGLAKAVMIDHADAWGAQLSSFVDDPGSVSSPTFVSAINGTWRLLGVSFPEALPRLDLFDLEGRIESFIEDGQVPESR
jgi:hypothetical protein